MTRGQREVKSRPARDGRIPAEYSIRASWADTILISAVETQIDKLVAEAAQCTEKEEKLVLLSASQCDRTKAWLFPFYGVVEV